MSDIVKQAQAGEIEVPEWRLNFWIELSQFVMDSTGVQEDIFNRYGDAESADDLFGEGPKVVSSENLASVPFLATGAFAVRQGKYKSTPYFLSIEAIDPVTDEKYIINTSSEVAGKKMLEGNKKGFFASPLLLKFQPSAKATAAGYFPLDLVRATDADIERYKKAVSMGATASTAGEDDGTF